MEAVRDHDLSGRTFLITGAYSGLGAATTEALLTAGANVVVAGRSAPAQQAYVHALAQRFERSRIDGERTLDLASLANVRDFARHVHAKHARIDCLINNAGVMNTPPGQTTDGFEIQMGTNVIGHFLLAKLLVDVTHRQVWLSSAGHTLLASYPGPHDVKKAPRIDLDAITRVDPSAYDGWRRYQQSKLGDILLAKQFPVVYPHLKACSVHPGVVRTNLGRHLSAWTMVKFLFRAMTGEPLPKRPEEGARTQTWCAVMPDAELVSGAYYADAAVAVEAEAAKNMDDAKRLYDFCDAATRKFQVGESST
jgi:NAD(P)-dependent dehydrogenase (short-subunit alcohol dehydrogenase family)